MATQKKLSDFQGYQAAEQKLAEVQTQHRAAIAERAELLATIEGTRGRTETLADQAQRLLSGDDSAVADVGDLRERYARVGRQVSLLGEVVRLAQQRADDERGKASASICESARPEFSKLVLAELKAARELLAAQDRRRTFWQDLADAGVSMATMPSVAALVKGGFRDPNATFWQRVADAVEAGYIEPDAFTPPAPATGGDNPMRHAGLRLLAAGPAGIGVVQTVGDGTTRPVKGAWHATPKTAPADGWGSAA